MILIGLGANLPSSAGEPEVTLRVALRRLMDLGIQVSAVSSFYRTTAWPDPADPPYVNAVARIETDLLPDKLLALLHSIEMEFGRHRSIPARGEIAGPSQPNAPRTLDLDLLDYNEVIQQGPPILPHPQMTARNFVMVPLCEIAPGWNDPITGKGAMEIMAGLPALG